jgi:hypothetical protein
MKSAKVNFDFASTVDDKEYSVTAKVTAPRPAPPQDFARFQEQEDDAPTVSVLRIVDESGREVYESDLPAADRHEIERTAVEHFYDDLSTN